MSTACAHGSIPRWLLAVMILGLVPAAAGQLSPRSDYASGNGGWRVQLFGEFLAVDAANAAATEERIMTAARRAFEAEHGVRTRFVESTLRDLRLRYAAVRDGQSVMFLPHPLRVEPGAPWIQVLELPAGVRGEEIGNHEIAQRIWRGIIARFPHPPFSERVLQGVDRPQIGGVRCLQGRGRLAGPGVEALHVEFAVVPLGDRGVLFQFFCGEQHAERFWPLAHRILTSLEGARETVDHIDWTPAAILLAGSVFVVVGLLIVRRRRRRRVAQVRLAQQEKTRHAQRRAQQRRAARSGMSVTPQSVSEAQQLVESHSGHGQGQGEPAQDRQEEVDPGLRDEQPGATGDALPVGDQEAESPRGELRRDEAPGEPGGPGDEPAAEPHPVDPAGDDERVEEEQPPAQGEPGDGPVTVGGDRHRNESIG